MLENLAQVAWLLLVYSMSEQPFCTVQNLLVRKLLETGEQGVKCVFSVAAVILIPIHCEEPLAPPPCSSAPMQPH